MRIYTDKVSTRLERRPQLGAQLEPADAGDTIVVWRLDRLARSLRELIDLTNGLGERRVGLRSLSEQLDTTTPGGRSLFHIMGAIAEFERDLIQERTQAGLAAARARGRRGGRPTVMTPDKIRTARELLPAGHDRRRHRRDPWGLPRHDLCPPRPGELRPALTLVTVELQTRRAGALFA